MDAHDLLTVTDVAGQLRVSEETVREWLRAERLHGYNFGGRTGWRIPSAELQRLLDSVSGKRERPA